MSGMFSVVRVIVVGFIVLGGIGWLSYAVGRAVIGRERGFAGDDCLFIGFLGLILAALIIALAYLVGIIVLGKTV